MAHKFPLPDADNEDVSDPRLNEDEDAELRLLHSLKGFGAVADSITSRYNALRKRDRRAIVRDPDDTRVATPIKKAGWQDPPKKDPASAEPLMSDTREVVPNQDDRRGFFRR